MSKFVKVLAGGFGIFITLGGAVFLFAGVSIYFHHMDNPKLLQQTITQIGIGTIMVVAGLITFGASSGAFKKPLYFLLPFIIIISFVSAGVFLPERIAGIKGEGALLISLAITIVGFRIIHRYYKTRDQYDIDQ